LYRSASQPTPLVCHSQRCRAAETSATNKKAIKDIKTSPHHPLQQKIHSSTAGKQCVRFAQRLRLMSAFATARSVKSASNSQNWKHTTYCFMFLVSSLFFFVWFRAAD